MPKPKAWHVTTFTGGPALGFVSPYGIVQSGDTLYVVDQIRNSLRTVHTATARLGAIVPGDGVVGRYVDGSGTSARFSFPTNIAAAAGSTFYVADSNNHRIREVSAGADAAATRVSTLAGSGTAGHADHATGSSAQFRNPAGLVISGDTLYVADQNNHRIRTVDLASADKTVSTIAGSGTAGHADHATGSSAQFRNPAGLALSGDTLYVADQNNHRIRAVDLASADKTVSTIAGDGTPGHADGAGAAAQFNKPLGLAINDGTLYVADHNNHCIRAIDIASADKTVRTIAGDGTRGNTNGIGTAARFNNPRGIAVSGDTLYVTTSGGLIRKLEYR